MIEAVRDGHAYIAPAEPIGCIEQPPSINRLAGLGWLEGGDPVAPAALFKAGVYHPVLTPAHPGDVAGPTSSFKP